MSTLTSNFEKFALALALTESDDNERAWGDDGGHGVNYLACGRWQMHPAFVWEFGPAQVQVLDSWNTVFKHTLFNFWMSRGAAGRSENQIAMEFHLGVAAVKEGRWAKGYDEDFTKHLLGLPTGSA